MKTSKSIRKRMVGLKVNFENFLLRFLGSNSNSNKNDVKYNNQYYLFAAGKMQIGL